MDPSEEVRDGAKTPDTCIPAAAIRSFLWHLGAVVSIGLLLMSVAQAARGARAGSPPEPHGAAAQKSLELRGRP